MQNEKVKLLVADTEKPVKDSLKDFFKRVFDFDVYIADNEKEVMDTVLKEKPSIVIMDIRIEGASLKTIEKIKKVDKETKIIITTTETGKDIIDEANRLGADKYMIKPVRLDELTDFIKQGSVK